MTKKIRENFFILVTSNLCTLLLVVVSFFFLGQNINIEPQGEQNLFAFSLPTILAMVSLIIVLSFTFANVYVKDTSEIVINNINNPVRSNMTSVITGKAEELRKRHLHEKESEKNDIYDSIDDYTIRQFSPYLKDDDIKILCENIRLVDINLSDITSLQSNGKLGTIDFKHYAWNIGERLGWCGNKRASFIKSCFPSELSELEIETIRRTLRNNGKCSIKLDVPDRESFAFHDTKDIKHKE